MHTNRIISLSLAHYLTITALIFATPALAQDSITNHTYPFHKAPLPNKTLFPAPPQLLNIGDDSRPNLSIGVQEFSLSASINLTDTPQSNLDLAYGYFFRDNWQIGVTGNISGGSDDIGIGLGVFTQYNFVNETKWVPFIGGSAEWARLNSNVISDVSTVSFGVEVGVKYFIKETFALSMAFSSNFGFDDVFSGGDSFQEKIRIGTVFYF